MIKNFFNNFVMYYKVYKVINFSILFLPINIFFLKIFLPIKKIKIFDFKDKRKVIYLRADNLITHFRSNLFFVKEKEVRHFIDEKLKKDQIFFDIGANIGVFSIYSAVRKNALVYSFEPEYSNLSILKENILKNRLYNNIFPYSLAIGKNNNLTNLHIADLTPGAAVSSISNEKIKNTDEGYQVVWKEGVVEMKLDDICDQLKIIPNMLKIDTDGNENNVLMGSENILKNKKLKFIIMEKPSNEKNRINAYEILKKNDYKEINIDNSRNSFWEKVIN